MVLTPGYQLVPESCKIAQWTWRYATFATDTHFLKDKLYIYVQYIHIW